MSSVSRAPGTVAAIALFVLPVIAVALRLAFPGWLLLVVFFVSPVLVLSYALAVVIMATGFLTRRAAFLLSRVPWRGITATWIAAVSSLLASFFFIDGGDSGAWGSPFTYALGFTEPPDAVGALSGALMVAFIALGVAAFIWLVIEWIIALVQRRKRSTPISI